MNIYIHNAFHKTILEYSRIPSLNFCEFLSWKKWKESAITVRIPAIFVGRAHFSISFLNSDSHQACLNSDSHQACLNGILWQILRLDHLWESVKKWHTMHVVLHFAFQWSVILCLKFNFYHHILSERAEIVRHWFLSTWPINGFACGSLELFLHFTVERFITGLVIGGDQATSL